VALIAPNPNWRTGLFAEIEPISLEDLKNGSDRIERLPEGFYKNNKNLYTKTNNHKRKLEIKDKMGFGKYADESIEWVMKHDENYFEWVIENIEWFSKKIQHLI
jgi:hypothetical protein